MTSMGWENGGQRDDEADHDQDRAQDLHDQLELDQDDDALPWLDGDDYEEEPGNDYRILIFAAIAVVALVAILFGANHFLSRQSDGTAEPDGSVIAAPDGDYKERPENPGGTEVAGTGDLSFEVGEGQGRESQIAGVGPAPSIDVGSAAATGTTPAGIASGSGPGSGATGGAGPAPGSATGVGVQVGAYSSRASAETGWRQLSGRYPALQGVGHRIIEGTADSGTIFRLQAIANDLDAANALCRSIRTAGGDCQVKR